MKSVITAGALALSLLASSAGAQPASPVVGLFAQDAAIGNQFEIAESKIILEQSTDPRVRGFAEAMIHDHQIAQAELRRAAGPSGVPADFVFDASHRKLVDDLGLMDSPKLDQTYLSDQIQAHASAVALLEDYAATGEDPSLRAYARATLPVVRHHQLELARLTDTPPAF